MPKFYIDGTRSMVPLEAVTGRALKWNGWSVPIATESQVRDFLAHWEDFLGSAEWAHEVLVTDYALVVTFAERDQVETWERIGTRAGTGEPVYVIDGWMWEAEPHECHDPFCLICREQTREECPTCGRDVDYCQGHDGGDE